MAEATTELVLGKHSGRHAFSRSCSGNGLSINDEKLNAAFVAFKKLADCKKEITEEDLFVLLTDQQVKTSEVDSI